MNTRFDLAVILAVCLMLPLLLAPAQNAARESSRRVQCMNNVKQIAYGNLAHEAHWQKFPAGGWATRWTGEPEQAFLPSQPGGWMYTLLPFIDQQAVFDLGLGAKSPEQKPQQLAKAQQTPLSIYTCSSRRRREPLPTQTTFFNAGSPGLMAKTDYVGNGGDGQTLTSFGNGDGMDTFTDDDWARQPLVEDSKAAREHGTLISNGVFQRRTGVPLDAITDGQANTYLLGEKYLYPEAYTTGAAVNDDQGWDVGFDADIIAFTRHFSPGGARFMNDRSGYAAPLFAFGGAHEDGLFMAMVDGSVHCVNPRIDPEVHAKLGIRNDGEKLEPPPAPKRWRFRLPGVRDG